MSPSCSRPLILPSRVVVHSPSAAYHLTADDTATDGDLAEGTGLDPAADDRRPSSGPVEGLRGPTEVLGLVLTAEGSEPLTCRPGSAGTASPGSCYRRGVDGVGLLLVWMEPGRTTSLLLADPGCSGGAWGQVDRDPPYLTMDLHLRRRGAETLLYLGFIRKPPRLIAVPLAHHRAWLQAIRTKPPLWLPPALKNSRASPGRGGNREAGTQHGS
ncbi:unnamed protein product [Pleuronectes platessa]|uniref:Uncharacterized protein n=1 Tax=Pleuronectes platessa TaxID=8262 RepID=A0A9N7VCI6_PLEPL|nr:unnamed protein product [Pleuronectes platessa]